MSIEALLNNTASLYRLTVNRGAVGGQANPTYSADVAAANVQCSIQPASATTRLQYLQRQMQVSHTLYFDQNWNPSSRDKWISVDKEYIVLGWFESLEIADSWTCDAFQNIVAAGTVVNEP